MLSCAPISMTMEASIANAKLARNCSVKTLVWVRNAGPMEEVAIRKTAPNSSLRCVVVILGLLSIIPLPTSL